jgi:bifunctional N-acetylglucosamine-1-phosphate-uridyltransferase/glucosamine-1-phosphate-acetyltransferase GlmU-like protein
MPEIHVVILAAGQGTRMKSALPKVLLPVSGRPMVEHVIRVARSVNPTSITVVVGHGADQARTKRPVGRRKREPADWIFLMKTTTTTISFSASLAANLQNHAA